MNWGAPKLLYLLLLIPVQLIVLGLSGYIRKKKFQRFAEERFFNHYLGSFSNFHWILKNLLFILALTFIIVAAARPRWGKEAQIVAKEGLDIAVCIDVSKSMDAADLKPSRIQRAKDHVSLFIDQLKGDRITIIPFAGESFVQLPLTDDYPSAKMFLSLLDTDTVPVPGTNIGYALETAFNTFGESDRNKIIILISDGEDLEDEGIEMARKIGKENVIIHALGVGSPQGSPIPIKKRNNNIEYAKDAQGNIVITKLDTKTLTHIAQAGGGRFYQVTPHQAEIFEILKAIETVERDKYESKEYVRHREQYHYFAGFALLLLILESLILTKKKVVKMRHI
jgi:Ca-activated chloride channel family protein